jgi:hypothetical protein
MSDKKCCRPNSSPPFHCGNNNKGINYAYSKFKDINNLGAFYKDYSLTKGKRILVNFGMPPYNEEAPNPIFPDLKIITYQETLNVTRLLPQKVPADYRNIGKYIDALERDYPNRNYSVILKIMRCMDIIINRIDRTRLNLKITFCNTGFAENDIRFDDYEMVTDRYGNNIELILYVDLYNSVLLNRQKASGKVKHIGKYPNDCYWDGSVSEGGDMEPIPQVLYINPFTNKLNYYERSSAGEDLVLEFVFNDRFYIFTETTSASNFTIYVNSVIDSTLSESQSKIKFKYKPIFDIDENNDIEYTRFYFEFKLVEIEENGVLEKPTICQLLVPNFVDGGDRKISFGIGKDPAVFNPIDNGTKISNIFPTIFRNKIFFSDTYSRTIFHEFCHILGMIHEFSRNSPDNPYQDDVWSENGKSEIDLVPHIYVGNFDFDSIMMYNFSDLCLFKPASLQAHPELVNTRFTSIISEQDIATLKSMYPLDEIYKENYNYKNININNNKILILILFLVFIILTVLLFL